MELKCEEGVLSVTRSALIRVARTIPTVGQKSYWRICIERFEHVLIRATADDTINYVCWSRFDFQEKTPNIFCN